MCLQLPGITVGPTALSSTSSCGWWWGVGWGAESQRNWPETTVKDRGGHGQRCCRGGSLSSSLCREYNAFLPSYSRGAPTQGSGGVLSQLLADEGLRLELQEGGASASLISWWAVRTVGGTGSNSGSKWITQGHKSWALSPPPPRPPIRVPLPLPCAPDGKSSIHSLNVRAPRAGSSISWPGVVSWKGRRCHGEGMCSVPFRMSLRRGLALVNGHHRRLTDCHFYIGSPF